MREINSQKKLLTSFWFLSSTLWVAKASLMFLLPLPWRETYVMQGMKPRKKLYPPSPMCPVLFPVSPFSLLELILYYLFSFLFLCVTQHGMNVQVTEMSSLYSCGSSGLNSGLRAWLHTLSQLTSHGLFFCWELGQESEALFNKSQEPFILQSFLVAA